MDNTPMSLLVRIHRSPSEGDWDRLVDLCSPVLYQWAKRMRMQDADAGDHVQEVMLLLLRKLPDFQYDPSRSFRGWLKTVATNRLYERVRKRAVKAGGSLSAIDPIAEESTRFWDHEYRDLMVQRALLLMQENFEANTWKACWEHTVEGRRAADIAAELGMSEGAVYVAKSRVLKRLREEFQEFVDD